MAEPHILTYDVSRSARANSFNGQQLPSGIWRLEIFARFAASSTFHAIVFAHLPYADGKRRKDPEGHPCLLLSQISEDAWTLESCQLHSDAPRTSVHFVQWVAPDGSS